MIVRDLRLSFAAAALAVASGPSLAADLPSLKAPPLPIAPPPLWTGFYAGLNAGYGFDAGAGAFFTGSPAAITATPPQPDVTLGSGLPGSLYPTVSGFLGGGQVGYNWQVGDRLVLGVEADIQGRAGGSSSVTSAAVTNVDAFLGAFPIRTFRAASAQKESDWVGTVRGRLGYLFTPQLLVYGSGGLAYGDAQLSSSTLAVQNALIPAEVDAGGGYSSDTRIGWTVGAGAEWMFLPQWSAKVEYLYYDLGNVGLNYSTLTTFTNFGNVAPGLVLNVTSRFNGHIARVGVNYHFSLGGPAPVVAKY